MACAVRHRGRCLAGRLSPNLLRRRVSRTDRFSDITGGIGSESLNCPLERVLKSATSVGYCFGVNTRGVEIERASRVQISLEQKDTKGAKNSGSDSRESSNFSVETVPSPVDHACPHSVLINRALFRILFVSFATFCSRMRPTPCTSDSPKRNRPFAGRVWRCHPGAQSYGAKNVRELIRPGANTTLNRRTRSQRRAADEISAENR
jgi:hypothetical protein